MFIKEIIMDGFKCYEEKTIMSNLDRFFNAIKGMNGVGKSNFIDAIIFCLNLDSIKSMRISSIHELININKLSASVTLKIVNVPIYGNIEVTKTITKMKDNTIKTTFKLNGSNCLRSTIDNLVKQMGISSNFIILQGHITKLINMKPHELQCMINEIAGTHHYNIVQEESLNKLEKKETELKIIQKHLENQIRPFLLRLEQEKKIYDYNQELLKNHEKLKSQYKTIKQEYEMAKLQKHIDVFKILYDKYKHILEEYNKIDKICTDIQNPIEVQNMINKLEIEQKELNIEDLENQMVNIISYDMDNIIKKKNNIVTILEELKDKKCFLKSKLRQNTQTQLQEIELLRSEINTLEIKLINYPDIDKDKNYNMFRTELEKEKTSLIGMMKNYNELQTLKNTLQYDYHNKNIYGTVNDLFEIIDNKYTLAVLTVLGNKVDFIVVENDIIGGELLENAYNKISVIPLNKLENKEPLCIPNCKNIIKCIRFLDKYKHIFNRFLGHYFIFDNKIEAHDACYKYKIYCITLDGTVYSPIGTVTGGKSFYQFEKKNIRTTITTLENQLLNFNYIDAQNRLLEINKLITAIEKKHCMIQKKEKLLLLENIFKDHENIQKEYSIVEKQILDTELQLSAILNEEKNATLNTNLKLDLEEKIKKSKIQHELIVKKITNLKLQLDNKNLQDNYEQRTLLFTELLNIKAEIKREYKKYDPLEIDETKILDIHIPNLLNQHVNQIINKDLDALKTELDIISKKMTIKHINTTMDPTNFNFLIKNSVIEKELKEKIQLLTMDKQTITKNIQELNVISENENKNALNHINNNLQRMVNYFLDGFSISIVNYKIQIQKDNHSYCLNELSGGQKSIIALCLMFATLIYRPAPIYIFDEVDSALDLNFTQSISTIIKNEFKTAQFFIISHKNLLYDTANKVYEIFIENKKSKIKQVK